MAGRLSVWGPFLAAALGVWIVAGQAAPAAAEYTYCNKTSYVLRSAIAFEADGKWTSRGWWTLLPGKCRAVLPDSLESRTYYTYAESVQGHKGGIKYFAGDEPFCVDEGYFTLYGRDECAPKGYEIGNFVKVRTDNSKNWTTTFTEPADFSTEKAEIAGVQRLLADNGYDAGNIDGHMGRKTRRAIAAFKRAQGLAMGGLITDELVTALAEVANSTAGDLGYTFCNRTKEQIWAAIGFEEAELWKSRGWWLLQPESCAKVIKDSLTQQNYYVYAVVDGPDGEVVITGGEHQLCTAEAKFDIEGRDDCALRGYSKSGFAQVETAGATSWTQNFETDDLALNN